MNELSTFVSSGASASGRGELDPCGLIPNDLVGSTLNPGAAPRPRSMINERISNIYVCCVKWRVGVSSSAERHIHVLYAVDTVYSSAGLTPPLNPQQAPIDM